MVLKAVPQDESILKVKNLSICFGSTQVLQELNFDLKKRQTLALVGESGSGKTLSSRALLRLLPSAATISGGEVWFHSARFGELDLLKAPEVQLRQIRGGEIGMVFQEPGSALNPVFRCGEQLMETIRVHQAMSRQQAREKSLQLLETCRLKAPKRIFMAYPHQLSGGQKQRVMIALALAISPSMIIADEPTTSLDLKVAAHIVALLRELQQQMGLSMLFITHDLGLVKKLADEVVVLRAGKVVEKGSCMQVCGQPRQAYTRALLACRPPLFERPHRLLTLSALADQEASQVSAAQAQSGLKKATTPAAAGKKLWEIHGLEVRFRQKSGLFPGRKKYVQAVKNVSFDVYEGSCLGLIGESGSGKTSLARCMLGLIPASAGEIWYKTHRLWQIDSARQKAIRQEIQIIFQDPFLSLNPRMPVGKAIEEPMRIHGLVKGREARRRASLSLLRQVGLAESYYHRYPQAFSGGERQRICIARALALRPRFLVCDECVSSLDVSTQAQILNLLKDLQQQLGLTYLFISHDLRVVSFMSDSIMVMKEGEIIERGQREQILHHPQHPYTRELIEAAQ